MELCNQETVIICKDAEGNNELEHKDVDSTNDLKINNNNTIKLPLQSNIKNIKDLFKYILKDQSLTTLSPDSFIHYSQLKLVNLNHNSFSMIPKELFQLSNLKSLYMDNNIITTIPPEIGQLLNLETLSLTFNKVHFIHSDIKKLDKLGTLMLNNNSLNNWPISLPVNLKKLSLHNNPMAEGIPLWFSKFESLIEFEHDWLEYLPGNNFTSESMSVISEIRKLCIQLVQKNFEPSLCSFYIFINHFVSSAKDFQEQQFPLHLAVAKGHVLLIKDLMNIIDINTKNKNKKTALALAFRKSNKKVVSLLLTNEKLLINRIISSDGTALHMALKLSWFDIADNIISHPLFSPNTKNSSGNTALHLLFTSYSSNVAKIKALCKKLLSLPDCDPNIRNSNNMTPLHCAAENNQVKCIRFCLKDNQYDKLDFNALGGQYNYSILHYLAVHSRIEIIIELLNFGVNVLARNSKGQTARQLLRSSIGRKIMYKYEKNQRLRLINKSEDFPLSKKTTIKAAPFLAIKTELMNGRKLCPKDRKFIISNPLSMIEQKKVLPSPPSKDAGKENLLTAKRNALDIQYVSEIIFLKESLESKCFWLQHMITTKNHSKLLKCKALYKIFCQCNEEAESVLKALQIKLNKTDPLLNELNYLYILLQTIRTSIENNNTP